MPIASGTRLGAYEVLELIGAGGMGEVYKARDTKLGRDVAIKVLPEAFSQDKERLARFEREARLLASLNHPNIAAIYGIEESDGACFLVLELVPGETLAERIARGPIPVDDALPLYVQITEALEAAHEKGIIHRDLKPANIKITPEGKVKVLDFGLAKAFEWEPAAEDLSQSPTMTREGTRAGVILGTAAYMSPEQARGKAVDKRTDIWAFGCCLFEALTGRKAFDGETVTDVLAAVVKNEPDWRQLPSTTPLQVREVLLKVLQKDVSRRLRDIGDARLEIESAIADPVRSVAAGAGRGGRSISFLVATGIALLAALISGLLVWSLLPSAARPLVRFTVRPPDNAFLRVGSWGADVAISPNGRDVAFVISETGFDRGEIYRRPISELEAVPVAISVGAPSNFFFSPDGEWIAGFDLGDFMLKKVPVGGGSAINIGELEDYLRYGASWGADDTIIFGGWSGRLWRISAQGGEPELLCSLEEGETGYRWPEILPGGKAVLFTLVTTDGTVQKEDLAVLSLETGERKVILQGGNNARYAHTGHLVYGVSGALHAVRFDLDRLEVEGVPVPVLEGVMTNTTGASSFALSRDGTVVYLSGDLPIGRHFVWVDRKGGEEVLSSQEELFRHPRISPDGQRIAVEFAAENEDIWIFDLVRKSSTRLTFDGAVDDYPLWTPDGQRLFFRSRRGGTSRLFWKPADGTGQAVPIEIGGSPANPDNTISLANISPQAFSLDGQSLLVQPHRVGDSDIVLLSLEEEPTVKALLDEPFNERWPVISPDGRFMAYSSDESGRFEIYVRPFPNVDGGKWQISTDGGTWPLWSPDGRELFFWSSGIAAVKTETEPAFNAGIPEVLFKGPYLQGGGRHFDISPDGERFLMVRLEREPGSAEIHVVLNWFEELKRLVPVDE